MTARASLGTDPGLFFGTYQRLGVHVGASTLDVIRAVRARLKRPLPLDKEGKARRKAIYQGVLSEHRQARRLYGLVMGPS